MLFKKHKNHFKKKLSNQARSLAYFWQPKTQEPNIGDFLALDIVEYMLALKDHHVLDKTDKNNKLLSIGSVLHFAKNNDTVWGSGRNGKVREKMHTFSSLDVRSVRGPKTREYLQGKGISCPEVYGDPALLSPIFYPERLMCASGPTVDYLIVPQLNDDMSFYNGYEELLVTPKMYPGQFIAEILKAKTIVSSSLHGVILAEAYGRNAIFLESGSGETLFKYQDYFEGTGRSEFLIAKTVEEAIKLTSAKIPDLDSIQEGLINAFPYDLWED